MTDGYHQLEERTLWRIASAGRERRAPSEAYFFDNAVRPAGSFVFQYTVSGSVDYRDERHAVAPVTAGHAMLFSYGEPTAYGLPRAAAATFVTEWINVQGAGVAEHWATFRSRYGSVIAIDPDGSVLPALRKAIDLANPQAGADALTIAAAVHAFVMLLFESQRRERLQSQPPVERALDELLGNPTAPWSLKEVADRHGVSREHLTRVFHRRMGAAPATWLAEAKLAKAVELLRETRLPVGEIAKQAGFASTHTMARHVRASAGTSPSGLRRAR